jgi:ADP-ribose pyrophosphatase YjhB (NUDIX family)
MLCLKGCCQIKISIFNTEEKRPHRRSFRKAGAFIVDPEENRILLVQSRGNLWGPPKGTLENETSIECAIREVKEETGLEIKATEFQRVIKIKNRAIYYYIERKTEQVHVQNTHNNDANGITWIKLDCLKDCVTHGNITLNQHCKIGLKRFMGIDLFVNKERPKIM